MVANRSIKVTMADYTPSKNHFDDLLHWTVAALVEVRIDRKCNLSFLQLFLRWLSLIREVNDVPGTVLKSKDKRVIPLIVDDEFVFAYEVNIVGFTRHLVIIDHPWLVMIRHVLNLNTWLSM